MTLNYEYSTYIKKYWLVSPNRMDLHCLLFVFETNPRLNVWIKHDQDQILRREIGYFILRYLGVFELGKRALRDDCHCEVPVVVICLYYPGIFCLS